jgi:uncharacterized membrane protein YbhN (UPF0104 family)
VRQLCFSWRGKELQIANCKLQIANWKRIGGNRGGGGVLSICNLQFAICNLQFAMFSSWGVLLGATVLSLVVQAVNVGIVWLVGQALGAAVPDAYYWIVVPMVTLLTLLPVSVNGMGVREGGMILFLAPLGISDATAVSLAFLCFAVYTAASLLGGLVYLFGRFSRPGDVGELSHEGVTHAGSVGGHSDQGRTGQFKTAA